jgi:very-short-patch-repair endonuclease
MLAAHQHGIVTRAQLSAAGLTPSTIEVRIEMGAPDPAAPWRLRPRPPSAPSTGHWLAAVLAAGPGGALSHREAAALHGLRPSSRSRIDVTTARRLRSRRPGIEIHHSAVLHPQDVTAVEGIPVTSVARTLVDLAQVLAPDGLAKALREAEHLRTVDVHELHDLMVRTRNRPGPGHAALRAVLREHRRRGTQLTRSVLEDRFLSLCDRRGLPRPRTNFHIGAHEVDMCWPVHRLAVELDGWARHRDRHAFQRDREKGKAITATGHRLLRFTHDDVVRRPAQTVATINEFLAEA